MTSDQNRNFIADQLKTIADDIEKLADNPPSIQVTMLINDLYQVMRQLSNYSEHSINKEGP